MRYSGFRGPLRFPAEFQKLTLEISQTRFQGFLISRVAASLDIVQNTRSVKQKTVALTLDLCLFGRQLHFFHSTPGIRGFDLAFNRFTFPTSSHDFIIALYRAIDPSLEGGTTPLSRMYTLM